MILCFDIGNTNIVLGMVKDKKIVDLYRFATDVNLTVDDYAIKFKLILNTNYEKEPLEGQSYQVWFQELMQQLIQF